MGSEMCIRDRYSRCVVSHVVSRGIPGVLFLMVFLMCISHGILDVLFFMVFLHGILDATVVSPCKF